MCSLTANREAASGIGWARFFPSPRLRAVLGWVRYFFQGPIPDKLNQLYIHDPTTVWGWYLARILIGTWIGVTTSPWRWWLRGPLFGFLVLRSVGSTGQPAPDAVRAPALARAPPAPARRSKYGRRR